VTARGIAKKYGEFFAVRGIDFEIERAECVGLLGPNGAGKSTTMRMIMGLSSISDGSLNIFGKPVQSLNRGSKARIGLVPQENNFDPDITVRENLEVFGRYFSLPKLVIRERALDLLEFMNLTDKADLLLNNLSGGMRRRLILSRALIGNPDLIILDEPTTGLDPQARSLIWNRLLELKNGGRTLLLSTHYMEEAQRLCDRIIIIDKGIILDNGSPKKLIERHVGKYVFEVQKSDYLEPQECKWFREDVGHSINYFVGNSDDFCAWLPKNAKYNQRLGNLEDVFFFLTGRQLRDS